MMESQRCHLVKTALKGTFMRFKGHLQPGVTIILVVKAVVPSAGTLQAGEATRIFDKPSISARELRSVVEVCSGIGCLGVGLEESGFEVAARCDWNQSLLSLAQRLHASETIHGDVCTDQLLADLSEKFPAAKTLAAGISCQPYSRLGDRRHQEDPRSQTLPGVLRLGFLGQYGLIVLECVSEAKTCPWVQQTLKDFAKETGYHITQDVLHLQQIWPTRRSRWWCVLAHPAIGAVQLKACPEVNPRPMVAHVLQQFQHVDEHTLKQLQLDLYELGKFAAFGFESNMVPWKGQMATSLHSCGNQLMGCPCGCRKYPFTEQRLNSGGLHGLLIRLFGESRCGNNVYPNFRHISPDELAFLNGMYPGCSWGPQTRLALCALGQLASPLQSAWIGACMMTHLHQLLALPEPSKPETVLLRLMRNLLKARDEVFGEQTTVECRSFQFMIDHMKDATVTPWTLHPAQVLDETPKASLAVHPGPEAKEVPSQPARHESQGEEAGQKVPLVMPTPPSGAGNEQHGSARDFHRACFTPKKCRHVQAKSNPGEKSCGMVSTEGSLPFAGGSSSQLGGSLTTMQDLGASERPHGQQEQQGEPQPMGPNQCPTKDDSLIKTEASPDVADAVPVSPNVRSQAGWHQPHTSECPGHESCPVESCPHPASRVQVGHVGFVQAGWPQPQTSECPSHGACPEMSCPPHVTGVQVGHVGPVQAGWLQPQTFECPSFRPRPAESSRPSVVDAQVGHVGLVQAGWPRPQTSEGTVSQKPCHAEQSKTHTTVGQFGSVQAGWLLPNTAESVKSDVQAGWPKPHTSVSVQPSVQAGWPLPQTSEKSKSCPVQSVARSQCLPSEPDQCQPADKCMHQAAEHANKEPQSIDPNFKPGQDQVVHEHVPDVPTKALQSAKQPVHQPSQTPIRDPSHQQPCQNVPYKPSQEHGVFDNKSQDQRIQLPPDATHPECGVSMPWRLPQSHPTAMHPKDSSDQQQHPFQSETTSTQAELNTVQQLLALEQAQAPPPTNGGVLGFESNKRRRLTPQDHFQAKPSSQLHKPSEAAAHSSQQTTQAINPRLAQHKADQVQPPRQELLPVQPLTGTTLAGGSLCGHLPVDAGPVVDDKTSHPDHTREDETKPSGASSQNIDEHNSINRACEEDEYDKTATAATDQQWQQIWVLHQDSRIPCEIKASTEVTPGQITQAEAKLGTMVQPIFPRTWVDSPLPIYEPLHAKQMIMLRQHPKLTKCPRLTTEETAPEIDFPCSRIQALWKQGSWVAKDEMDFYLSVAEINGGITVFQPNHYFSEAAALEEAGVWLCHPIHQASDSQTFASAAIIDRHWVPVVFRRKDSVIQLCTTPEGSCFIQSATEIANDMGKTLEVTQKVLPQQFHADCGFQAFAWIIANLSGCMPTGILPKQAEGWRYLFAKHLLDTDEHLQVISSLALGGTKHDPELSHKLTELLVEHGVWADRATERATTIMEKIPHGSIRNALAAKRPWAELKQAANQVRPMLKLIMQDELDFQIATRASHRNQFGRKPVKAAKRQPELPRPPLVVTASELEVPPGVFKQQDGSVLGPLRADQVQPNAEGVVLVDQAEAAAVLKLPRPVTQKGLAVLVLATKENEQHHEGEPIRFPAMCHQTQEPIIASGYLYQLGSQSVQRNEPAVKLAVDERQIEAIRCIVYQDQAGALWDEMQAHPVKTIFTNEPLLQADQQGESQVIDVWDRQWVTKRYEKVKAKTADMFVFSFRMIADRAPELITKSGTGGIYYEP